MKIALKILGLGAAFAVAGCSTFSGGDQNDTPQQQASSTATANIETPDRGLPAQELLAGECGLFLWTRREEPEFVYFSRSNSDTALFWLEGQTESVIRSGVGGDIFGQELTEQFFDFADGRKLELEMEPGDMLVGGQRIPEAIFRVIDAEGFATLIPAAGVSACQPES